MKERKKKIMAGGVAFIAAFLAVLFVGKPVFDSWSRPQYMDIFENKDFEAVYFTMEKEAAFSEEDFLTYRGLKTVKAAENLQSFKHISKLLNAILKSQPDVNTVYMEINPVVLWENASGKQKKWQSKLEEHMLEIIRSCPDTTFEILLTYPGITYWTDLAKAKREEYLQAYQFFADAVAGEENVLLFYVGAEQWLHTNLSNYEDTFRLNAEVEKHIFLSVFCDRAYLTNSDNMKQKLDILRQQIEDYPARALDYPDFSDWSFVFFGDSIIGIDKSSRSIPGVVGALSKAVVYNCGMSGALASGTDSEFPSFLDTMEYLIEGREETMTDGELRESIDSFLDSDYQENKLCFFVNYGLNDYFTGCSPDDAANPYDPESYAGALRLGITALKDAYPQAKIVVLVPTYIRTYEEGTLIQGEKGQQLAAYRKAAVEAAKELSVYYKDNFADMPIDETNHKEFLSDECHLNEKGRFLFGEQLVCFLKEDVIR